MPLIPEYKATRNVNARTIAPPRQGTDALFKNIQTVSGAVQKVTQQWSDAHDSMQRTKAKSEYEIQAEEIKGRAALDKNFGEATTAKYNKELEKARAESVKGIDNQAVAQQVSAEIGLSNTLNSIKIGNNFRQKEIAANKVNVATYIEAKAKEMATATDAERLNIQADIKNELDLNFARGTLSQAEGAKIIRDALEEAANYDAVVNPDKYLSKDAEYYGIDKDDYKKGREVARLSKERGKKEIKEAQRLDQIQNHTTLTKGLANGEITRLDVPRITNMMREGKISQQFGESYIRVLTSPKAIGRTKAIKRSGFIEFAEQLFKAETPEQEEAALIKIFNATADGEKLKDEEMAVLLKGAEKASKEGRGFMAGVGKLFRASLKINPGFIIANYVDKITNGDSHDQAKEEAIAEEQMRVNSERTQYSIGDMIDTPRGPMYVWGYYEDGEPDVRFEKTKK